MEGIISILENNLPEINCHVDDINSGGCGVFALELGKILEDFNPQYLIFTYSDSLKNYKLKVEDTMPCRHVFIKVFDRYIDSDGFHSLLELQNKYPFSVLTEISRQELEYFVSIKSNWNSYFDRETDGPVVIEFLSNFKNKILCAI